MAVQLDRSKLRSRYLFTGTIELDTALHLGGGKESSTITDSPVLRDAMGRPIIPGSSIKGAFRAAVDRLLPHLGYTTCLLERGADCLSTEVDLGKAFRAVSEAVSRGASLGNGTGQIATDQVKMLNDLHHPEWAGVELTEEHLLILLDEQLCDACKTFGSPYLASAVSFHDLPVIEPWAEITQIRDGVGIDRDSERAIDQIKFDYEIVPAQTQFSFKLSLENPRPEDLALVALGLQELLQGMIPLGGIRSRGLGRCHVLDDLKVSVVDFSLPVQLKAYLLEGKMRDITKEEFFQSALAAIS